MAVLVKTNHRPYNLHSYTLGMTAKLFVTFMLLVCATASSAFGALAAPEIDGNTAVSAIALVAGGLLVIRGRKR